MGESAGCTTELPPLTQRQYIIIVFMSVMALSTYILYAFLAPFYPGVALSKGVTVSQVGLVFASYFIGVFVASLILGNFVGVIGPKFMYISGMFVRGMSDSIFGILIYAPDGTVFLVLCIVVRVFESVGSAAFNTALLAILAKEFPGRIASLNGWMWACNAAGLMMGPPLGGVMYEVMDFTFPFLILGGAMLFVLILTVCFMPGLSEEEEIKMEQKVRRKKKWVFSLLWNPSIVIDCICTMLMYGPITFVEISLETLLEPFGLSSGMIGLVFTCEMASYAISSFVVGHINNHIFYARYQQIAACLIYAISFLCLAPSHWLQFSGQVWTICLCLVGIGVAASSINSASVKDSFEQALLDGYPDSFDTHGLVSGLYLSAMTLGAFVCTYGGSYVVEVYDFPLACTMFALIMFSVAAIVALYKVFEDTIHEHRRRTQNRSNEDYLCESTALIVRSTG